MTSLLLHHKLKEAVKIQLECFSPILNEKVTSCFVYRYQVSKDLVSEWINDIAEILEKCQHLLLRNKIKVKVSTLNSSLFLDFARTAKEAEVDLNIISTKALLGEIRDLENNKLLSFYTSTDMRQRLLKFFKNFKELAFKEIFSQDLLSKEEIKTRIASFFSYGGRMVVS